MNNIERGQVISSAAEIYEEFFIPALFIDWPGRVVQAAGITAGQRVLDVACGTGVLTREAAAQVGPSGSVIGLDINEGMLAVAERRAPQLEWRHGRAEELPFDDNRFDAVVSQFGLMFFADRQQAIAEMVRVLRPGGRLAVAVWDSLENTPGYLAVTEMLQRLFGDEVAESLRAPYALGDTELLASIFSDADLAELSIQTVAGRARFPSIESWMYTDIKGWTLADVINEAQYEQLLQTAAVELRPFVQADDTVSFSAPAHIVTGHKK